MKPILTREADLNRDRDLIVEFLRERLTLESDQRRFEWLYLRNPAGRACVKIATECKSDKTVGIAAAFPRLIFLGSDLITGWVLGDFCIAPEYRTAGPALTLQRSLLDEIQRESSWLYYDFPSTGMMAIYRRLGVDEFGQLVRYVKYLRSEPIVRKVMPIPILEKSVSTLLDLCINRQPSSSENTGSIETSTFEHRFNNEFTELSLRTAAPGHARLAKDADYLNWRFRECPHRNHLIITARRDGILVGFSVTRLVGELATILDLVSIDSASAFSLLKSTIFNIRQSPKIARVDFPLLDSASLAHLVDRTGFRAREGAPVVLASANLKNLPAEYLKPQNWSLTSGDRDS